MPQLKKFDACAKIGSYEKAGETKGRWLTIGTVFENEKGNLNLKLESIPTSNEWNGWVSFFPPRTNDKEDLNKLANKPPVDPDDIPF